MIQVGWSDSDVICEVKAVSFNFSLLQSSLINKHSTEVCGGNNLHIVVGTCDCGTLGMFDYTKSAC